MNLFDNGMCPTAEAPLSALLRACSDQADLDPTTRTREHIEAVLRGYLALRGVHEVEIGDDEIKVFEDGIKEAMADVMLEQRRARKGVAR